MPAGTLHAQSNARVYHTTTLLPNGNTLITGGLIGGVASTNVEILSAAGDCYYGQSFSVAPVCAGTPVPHVMNVARASHTATLLPNGKVLVAGGINGGVVQNSLEVYDPIANSWTNVVGTLNPGVFNHTATLLPNGLVLIAGGDSGGAAKPNTYLFDSNGNSLVAGPAMGALNGRSGHTATLLFNGRVFVAGGYDYVAPYLISTEVYNPQSNSWTPGPAMSVERAYHTATALGNQKVLIAGGLNNRNLQQNQGILQSTDLYNPVDSSISPAASMNERKLYHTATLRPDGTVSIYGGLGNITTSYFNGPLNFQPGSFLGSSASGGPGQGTLTPGFPPTILTVEAKFTLSVPANGIISSGTINFSSPTASLTDAGILFTDPGTRASLNGVPVGTNAGLNPGQVDAIVQIINPTGRIQFNPQTVSALTGFTPTVSGGAINFTPTPLPPGQTSNPFAGQTFSAVNVAVPFPVSDIGGNIISCSANMVSGVTIINTGVYTITLNGGTTLGGGSCAGGTVVSDGLGGAYGILTLTFVGVGGTVTNNAATGGANLNSPITGANFNGVAITGLSMKLTYLVSPVNLGNATFKFDVGTVAIANMVFSDIEKYDPSQNQFSFGNSAYPAFNHTMVLHPNADQAIFGGQTCGGGSCSPAGVSYVPLRGGGAYIDVPQTASPFAASGNLVGSRANHSVTVLPNGKVLAAGGTNGPNVLSSSELYDPVARTWSQTGTMVQPRNLHTATLLTDGTVLAVGGFSTGVTTGEINTAELYFPNSGAWSMTAPMVSSRSYQTATLLADGTVLVAGGFANGLYLNSAEIYSPHTMGWTQLGPCPGIHCLGNARAQHTATLLQNGKVLFAGGVNGSGVLASAEIYDPAAQTFSAAAALNTANGAGQGTGRFLHTSTLLRDGRVLVAGGDDGFGEIAIAEIYDPVANAWNTTNRPNNSATRRTGNDMNVPRLKHSAVLMPGGKVMVTGGLSALGQSYSVAEVFDEDQSSWTLIGQMNSARGLHASVLLGNNHVLNVAGFNGLSYLNTSDDIPWDFSENDQSSPGPSTRNPVIVALDTMTALNVGQQNLSVQGQHFRGVTEASGGGAAEANAAFSHPRAYLQRLDSSGNNSAGGAGFVVDMTTAIFTNLAAVPANTDALWTLADSSFSLFLPSGPNMPLGLYSLRVADNGQYSSAQLFQVGPKLPAPVPGIPSGALVGISSVAWSWDPVPAGTNFDGYHVYSATNGVYLGSAPVTVPPIRPTFIHANLGTNAVSFIQVAAYNISGDGPVAVATVPINTITANITGLRGVPVSAPLGTTQISWSWNAVPAATGYRVISASSGTVLGNPSGNSFIEMGLSTNTPYGVAVQAVTPAGLGPLSPQTTNFTSAAVPIPGGPPLTNVTSSGFLAQWFDNGNPPYTQYIASATAQTGALVVKNVPSTPGISSTTFSGQPPNTLLTAAVAAVNGDGLVTSYTSLGTTCTFANPPANLIVTFTQPSVVGISWNTNGNPAYTGFQVRDSSDAFVTNFSTPIPFSPLGVNYTTPTASLGGLLTGVTYYIDVTAQNQFGQKTAAALVLGYTNNGGGPPGSLVFNLPAGQGGTLTGNLPNTAITLNVPTGSFDDAVTIFIASQSVLHCGGLTEAIQVVIQPPDEPHHPVRLAMNLPNPNPGNLAIARYDGPSATCVPLTSEVDAVNSQIYTFTNHLSDFQLMQVLGTGDLSGARAFPNPVYMNTQGYITFDRIPANTRVRLFTLKGEELFEGTANSSGMVQWFANNKVGRPVASGIYLAVIEAPGAGKKILKVVVVR